MAKVYCGWLGKEEEKMTAHSTTAIRADLRQTKANKVLLTMCSSAVELILTGYQGR